MIERGALSCLMLPDQVYQTKLLYRDKMPGQGRTVQEESTKEEPLGTYCVLPVLPHAQKGAGAAVGWKAMLILRKRGYTSYSAYEYDYEYEYSYSAKAWIALGTEIAPWAGNQRETGRHGLPPEVLLSGQQHLRSPCLPPQASPVGVRLQ